MKKILFLLFALSLTIYNQAQSVSPQVVSSAGDYYENGSGSISWTLGEIATETYSNANVVLTQGFQQPITVTITGINLNLLVYLEGPFSGTAMQTDLNNLSDFPLTQPYNTAPWNYTGTESIPTIPNPNIVDWVLIELRDAAAPGLATPATTILRKAAFLLTDGSIVDLDGSSTLDFPAASYTQNLYAVIWHRNHLGIMSGNALSESGGIYNYDFSTSATQVYNGTTGYNEIATGVYGMVAGDANADGQILDSDKSLWKSKAGQTAYQSEDFNMNGQTDNKDKNDKWFYNQSKASQIPN